MFKWVPCFKRYRRVAKLMKRGEDKLIGSISVQVMYETLRQHSLAFKTMGITLEKIEKEVIELSTEDNDSNEDNKNRRKPVMMLEMKA
jgi:hypothetical protein